MKVIKSDSGLKTYEKVFKKLQGSASEVILWQVSNTTGERTVVESRLNSVHSDMSSLEFKNKNQEELTLELPIYCYCKEVSMIFKSNIQSSQDGLVKISMPLEIKMLEEEEVTEFAKQMSRSTSSHWISRSAGFCEKIETYTVTKKTMNERSQRDQEFLNNEFDDVSIEEEERMFADKRESPRSRPAIDKWVKLRVDGFDDVKFLRLFDLSRGGMSFLAHDLNNFPKGNSIQVLGFEEFDLDDPLIGKILSHRSLDKIQNEYKIGIKFEDGQD